jgi:hypothetical protein
MPKVKSKFFFEVIIEPFDFFDLGENIFCGTFGFSNDSFLNYEELDLTLFLAFLIYLAVLFYFLLISYWVVFVVV